jgi:hypothetical protein
MTDFSAARIGLVSNPASGHNRDQFDRVRARIDACAAIEHRITRSPEAIPLALEQLAEQGISVLAINGGDGTAAAIIGSLLECRPFASPPALVLLPGGTANMNAGDVGLRGRLLPAVDRFCAWCEGPRREAQTLRRHLLRLQAGGAAQPRYGMFLGAGAVIQGTEYAHRNIHSRGLRDDFSILLGTLRTVWGVIRNDPQFSRPTPLRLSLDGAEPQRFDVLILAISTLERLAFGMQPFWAPGSAPLRLTLIEQGSGRFLRTFAGIVSGRGERYARAENGYHSHRATTITLALEGDLNLDGEIIPVAGSVGIAASPALEFLRL